LLLVSFSELANSARLADKAWQDFSSVVQPEEGKKRATPFQSHDPPKVVGGKGARTPKIYLYH